MKVLVIGSGGREHAIIWKLAQSERVKKIFAVPGNAGMSEYAVCVNIKADDITELVSFAVREQVDLVAVGPEVPLCLGIADAMRKADISVFGPSAAAARLEGSKTFSKMIMKKYGIPTAAFGNFDAYDAALSYARSLDSDMWIKASGLAAGKGAVYAADPDEADRVLRRMMVDREFGDSGDNVVIEENMSGEEASIFAMCDGETYRLLVSSQDHKRAFDDDTGPNTGGMGAYAPAPVVTDTLMAKVERDIIQPTLAGMATEGSPYKGLLYTGIMITPVGPKVVEYNCRFGDPETQAVLPLLDGDLAELMLASADGGIRDVAIDTVPGSAVCVVIASGGYPGEYKKGYIIRGIDEAESLDRVKVFHAGTKFQNGSVVTAGGRVLGVTAWGSDFISARDRAYKAVDHIDFTDCFCRRDIGFRALTN